MCLSVKNYVVGMGNFSYSRCCSIRTRDINPTVPTRDWPCVERNSFWWFQESNPSALACREVYEQGYKIFNLKQRFWFFLFKHLTFCMTFATVVGDESGWVHNAQHDIGRDQQGFWSAARRHLSSLCPQYQWLIHQWVYVVSLSLYALSCVLWLVNFLSNRLEPCVRFNNFWLKDREASLIISNHVYEDYMDLVFDLVDQQLNTCSFENWIW